MYRVRLLMAAVAVAACGAAWADPPPWAHPGGAKAEKHSPRSPEVRQPRHGQAHGHFHVSTRERFYIRNWYRRHRPHGLAKKGGLPPGIAKKVYPGSAWPPPYAYRPLPSEVVRNLQPLPQGYRYYEVAGSVVIANVAGHVVSDVVYDLLTR